MVKFVQDIIFGIALGIGFNIATNVLHFIAGMLGGH